MKSLAMLFIMIMSTCSCKHENNPLVYDHHAGSVRVLGNMNARRAVHTATMLNSGSILIAGGLDGLSSTELYDLATKSFTAATNMNVPRAGHTATLLPDGRVLIAGGYGANVSISSKAWLYKSSGGN
jgi:hypothetical protein